MTASVLSATLVVLFGIKIRPRARARTVGGVLVEDKLSERRTGFGRLLRLKPARSLPAGPADVASWCDDLARAVRSGATLSASLRSAVAPTPIRHHTAAITLALDRGQSVGIALDQPCESSDLNVALTVLRACAAHGGSPAEPIDRAAATLRGRASDEANRRVQSAQARMSAVVMTVLPIAMLLILIITSASVRGVVASPTGIVIIVVGGGLNATGWRWMNRLVGGHG
jgi:tight adherence protein B